MNSAKRQQGLTLVVSLIMLIVLTLLVTSAIRSSNVNLRIVGNVQKQAESTAAAQQAIDQVISNDFTADLIAAAAPVSVDIDNDSVADYAVTVAVPKCLSAAPVPMSELDPSVAPDQFCFQSISSANSGIIGGSSTSTGNSVCNETQWDIAATARDSSSGASSEVHQGIAVRVGIDVTCQ